MQSKIAIHINEIGGRTIAGQDFFQQCLFLDKFNRGRKDIGPLLNFFNSQRDAP
jgi:hypothetical protein